MKKMKPISHQRASAAQKLAAHYNRALNLEQQRQYPQAIAAYEKFVQLNPSHFLGRLKLGLCLLLNNQPIEATKVLHPLHEEKPDDVDVLRLCAKSYIQLGQFAVGLEFLKRAVKQNPENHEIWLDLAYAASANQQETNALYYATQAVALNPTDPRSHLNLGSTLSAVGRLDDAMYCYKTVLALDPKNASAISNCGLIHEKWGQMDEALVYLEQCKDLIPKGTLQYEELLYKMSYPLLAKGRLKEGWAMYEHGFAPNNTLSRAPKRKFAVPKWQGQPIHGKKLLVWREQGLGDEIMFLHTLPDALALCDDVIIECEERLIALLQRSFPSCTIRKQSFTALSGLSPVEDFDYQIPMGSLQYLFRTEIDLYKKNRPYLKPDPNRVEALRQRLAEFKPKRLIGFCWRSGMVSAERNIHYAALADWQPLFALNDCAFVNLQYGDCTQEIADLKNHFGIDLIHWPDLDLRNDLEGVAALIANMDCVVSVGTAVAQMTGAIGTPMKLLVSKNWSLLGQDFYPWFGNTELFVSDYMQPVDSLIPDLVKQLEK